MTTREQILNILKEHILFFDGAMGTQIQKYVPDLNTAPEILNIENKEILKKIHTNYIQTGCNFIETNTFGGTSLKLKEYNLQDKVERINKNGVTIAQQSIQESGRDDVWVAASIGPTGKLLEPFGEFSFDEIYKTFSEQTQYLYEAGARVFILETMADLQEMRAALIATREKAPDALIIAQLTYDVNHKTLTGTDPVTATAILEKLGADIIGTNCSTGPNEMVEVIQRIAESTEKPVSALPNAGIPKLVENNTIYDMTAEYFSDKILEIINNGANIVGGCCGTTPEFISKIIEKSKNLKPKPHIIDLEKKSKTLTLASRTQSIKFGPNYPVRLIGERINPTARKNIAEDLKQGKFISLKKEAMTQNKNGADILDVNVGEPTIDEVQTMKTAIMSIQNILNIPLCLDSTDVKAIEEGLKVYSGRALLNSINCKKESYETLFPLAKKYGAAFILLPINEKGIPQYAEERFEIIEHTLQKALNFGFNKNDILVDGLVMTISTTQKLGLETLKTIELVKTKLGLNTVLGVSNISFGLPARKLINSTFLSMAIGYGLDSGILNPLSNEIRQVLDTGSVLTNRDKNAIHYIEKYSKIEKTEESTDKKKLEAELNIEEKIYNAVVKGDKEQINDFVKEALNLHYKAIEIINKMLIPGITKVGDYYENGTYFLPQLISSAETMQSAFSLLKPLLQKEGNKEKKIKLLIATVKGDVHDIGKKIVAIMLENNGFEVTDMGKDVPNEVIIEKAKKENIKLIGLSALMTTTMPEMKKMAELIKEQKLDFTLFIGGAAVNEDYAKKIGAHYSKDAVSAVKLLKKLTKNLK